MTNTYLITPADFQQYEDISVNIKPERLNIFIKKAQDLDLKPFLGHALYYALIACFNEEGELKSDAPGQYQNLVNGCDYTDGDGHTISYEGLKPMLVYFTFARFIENDAFRYTPSGPVIKQQDQGQALAAKDIIKLVQQQRSVANAHANEVEKFLNDNKPLFNLWQPAEGNRSARQAGPRIRAVDRTVFNYPASDYYNYSPLTEFLN